MISETMSHSTRVGFRIRAWREIKELKKKVIFSVDTFDGMLRSGRGSEHRESVQRQTWTRPTNPKLDGSSLDTKNVFDGIMMMMMRQPLTRP